MELLWELFEDDSQDILIFYMCSNLLTLWRVFREYLFYVVPVLNENVVI